MAVINGNSSSKFAEFGQFSENPMSSVLNKTLIVEYWFRILCGDADVSIKDIAKIVDEFATEIEKFDPLWTHESLKLNDEGTIVSLFNTKSLAKCTFGTILAIPGGNYHWRFKILMQLQGLDQILV